MPIAMNCRMPPTARAGVAGVTVMETSVGAVEVTVNVVEPVIFPTVARILVLPTPRPVANPVVEMLATVAVGAAQTAFVMTAWLPSE